MSFNSKQIWENETNGKYTWMMIKLMVDSEEHQIVLTKTLKIVIECLMGCQKVMNSLKIPLMYTQDRILNFQTVP